MRQPSLFDDLNDDEPQPIPATFRAPAPTTRPAAPVPPPRPDAPGDTRRLYRSHTSDGATLGEAISYAWHNAHGGTRIGIPIGVVAALALWPIGREHPHTLGEWFMRRTPEELQAAYREVTAWHWVRRPDLIEHALPILQWTEEELDKNQLSAVREVTHAALRHGVLESTGSADPYVRSGTDLMSWALTSLRSHGARQGLGEYHTPPEVCDVMARITYDADDLGPGQWFNDPCAGTGGMYRSLANHLRELGRNPHDYVWVMQDIDALAAAGAAVNAIIWDLGPNVLISCGDTLAEGDLTNRAIARRKAVLEHRDEVMGQAAVLAGVRRAEDLISRLLGGSAAA
ncbi:N-6 DNA methylase [Streptomyces sp. NPDC101213]|uniref:N-6 DNA methylase n=1 Tax=Streptomyces sp. NPDC101213 TaxID=3366130 RepID=UPI0037F2D411